MTRRASGAGRVSPQGKKDGAALFEVEGRARRADGAMRVSPLFVAAGRKKALDEGAARFAEGAYDQVIVLEATQEGKTVIARWEKLIGDHQVESPRTFTGRDSPETIRA